MPTKSEKEQIAAFRALIEKVQGMRQEARGPAPRWPAIPQGETSTKASLGETEAALLKEIQKWAKKTLEQGARLQA